MWPCPISLQCGYPEAPGGSKEWGDSPRVTTGAAAQAVHCTNGPGAAQQHTQLCLLVSLLPAPHTQWASTLELWSMPTLSAIC